MYRLWSVVAVSFFLTIACGKKSGGGSSVAVQLMRISGSVAMRDQATMASNEDIVIDSLKQVVSDIALSPGTALTGSNSTPLYACTGGSDQACEVDLAEKNAVENLLTSAGKADLKSDTYTFATVGTCVDNVPNPAGGPQAGYYLRIKVHAKLAGKWWYSTATSDPTNPTLKDSGLSSAAAFVAPTDYGYARIYRNGCRNYNVFQAPLAVTAGQDVTLKLFFDLRHSVHVNYQSATSVGLGAWFTYLAAIVDTEKPDLQRYRLEANGGAQIFGIYLKKGTRQPAGAYNYAAFADAFSGGSGFGEVIKHVSSVSDGVLKISTYGGQTSTDYIDDKPGSFNTETFSLLASVNATGTVSYTDGNGVAKTAVVTRIE